MARAWSQRKLADDGARQDEGPIQARAAAAARTARGASLAGFFFDPLCSLQLVTTHVNLAGMTTFTTLISKDTHTTPELE